MSTKNIISIKNTKMNRVIEQLLEKYSGLRQEDLCEINPKYSCVICADTLCMYHNSINHSCQFCVPATKIQWMMFYDCYKNK